MQCEETRGGGGRELFEEEPDLVGRFEKVVVPDMRVLLSGWRVIVQSALMLCELCVQVRT